MTKNTKYTSVPYEYQGKKYHVLIKDSYWEGMVYEDWQDVINKWYCVSNRFGKLIEDKNSEEYKNHLIAYKLGHQWLRELRDNGPLAHHKEEQVVPPKYEDAYVELLDTLGNVISVEKIKS